MKKFVFLFTCLLSLSSSAFAARVTHLVFANGTIHARCTWTQGPQSPDESLLRVEWVRSSDHAPIEPPGSFKVALFMPGMGHGSAPTQLQRVLDEQGRAILGSYQVSNMYFTMRGEWVVNVTLKFPDGSEETKAISVRL